MERESVIFVTVEELNKTEALALGAAEVAVVLEVVEELVAGDVAGSITVHALEAGVGGKVSN